MRDTCFNSYSVARSKMASPVVWTEITEVERHAFLSRKRTQVACGVQNLCKSTSSSVTRRRSEEVIGN